MLDSGFFEFKLDYPQTKDLAIGDAVYSDNIFAGGHVWRIICYPRGDNEEFRGEYISIYLELVSHGARNVKAIFDAFLMGRDDGAPSPGLPRRCAHVNQPNNGCGPWGWSRFTAWRDVEADSLTDGGGSVTFVCGVVVLRAGAGDGGASTSVSMPRADVASHLGNLLQNGVCSDVSFRVAGETFPAHRAVLAARSPVFKAELFGPMAEATMPSIRLRDIEPDTFRDMLHLMYTDKLPELKDFSSTTTMAAAIEHAEDVRRHAALHEQRFQALLAAADRYALDLLKLVCAQKLCDVMSLDNVTAILRCAELHSCPVLKSKCLDFFTEEKNFRKLVLTEGYLQLVQSFPSLIEEIKERIENQDLLQEKESRMPGFLNLSLWNFLKALALDVDK